MKVAPGAETTALDGFRNRIRGRLSELGEPQGFGAAEVFSRISDL
jgi:hypothetical protein